MQRKKIGLTGNNKPTVSKTIQSIYEFLQNKYELHIDIQIQKALPNKKYESLDKLASICELIIVIGGDGSMLRASKIIANSTTKVIGINQGKIGFLTDINPKNYQQELIDIIEENKTSTEDRILLNAQIYHNNKLTIEQTALNEIVIQSSSMPALIEFEIHINNIHLSSQRADGLIIATPTGSTAYSLSAGGAVISPKLEAFLLIPLFPYNLNTRPIIVEASEEISIIIKKKQAIKVNFDGHINVEASHSNKITIKKHEHSLKLIHPKTYNYFSTLKNKLNWE